MFKYVSMYISRDTSPIIGQHKLLCREYLKDICGPGQKQKNYGQEEVVQCD